MSNLMLNKTYPMFLSNCGDNCFKFILVYFYGKVVSLSPREGALF
jgi:hypothetical protein